MPARRPLLLLLASLAAVAAAVALLLAASRNGSGGSRSSNGGINSVSGFAGAALPEGVRAPDFTLTDQDGHRLSLAALRGQVTMLAFLSTSCAPACVLAAQQMRGALDELTPAPAVVLVSVDPAADTPARVRRFLADLSLAGRAHFLTGPASALRAAWLAYGVRPLASGRTAFERALEVRLIDRRGRERVLFGLEQLTPEALAHDVRMLGAE
jgi:cytochrome oxidase Cu insertion factor (SCO1/SenC/PrrC family)